MLAEKVIMSGIILREKRLENTLYLGNNYNNEDKIYLIIIQVSTHQKCSKKRIRCIVASNNLFRLLPFNPILPIRPVLRSGR